MIAPQQRLGRYKVVQLLGRGGMGEVWLATAHGAAGFEKPVVLKLLRPKYAENPERTARLLREAFIGVGLDHSNLVSVLDLGLEGQHYYLAMEYVRGFHLGHYIAHATSEKIPMPVACAVHVARAVAAALDYVHHFDAAGHAPGLMHRDVSPSNVLLGLDGRVKLSDFGVATLADDPDAEHVAGKPPYLPPEAFTGGRPSPLWDVYALGATLYEALAARRAFPGDTWREVVASIQRGPEPLRGLRPDAPAALSAVLERAIHASPGRRFESAAAFRDALDAAAPREVDDGDRLRSYLVTVAARPSFSSLAGPLPDTGDAVATARLRPGRGSTPRVTPSVEGVTREVPPPQPGEETPLRLGLSPALGPALARASGERLAARLQDTLGRPIRSVVVASYRELVSWLSAGEVDFAWMPPAAFVDAAERGAVPLVVARRRGRTTYESAVLVRADSGLHTLTDLRGTSAAWVDRESAAGYLFAVAAIAAEVGPPATVFNRQHFLGSHQAVCEAVANGWAAACATYVIRDPDGRIESSAWSDLMGPRAGELRPIAFAGPIPGDNLAHRPGLPAETADRLASALVALSGDEEGRLLLRDVFSADGLVHAAPEDYDTVRATIHRARQVA